MAVACILIVESNSHLRSLLSWQLQQVGNAVYQASEMKHAKELFYTRQPTLVILEAELPDGNGLELCQWLQPQQPLVLMISARNTESDIVAGLQAGADDYLTKPFGIKVFMARVDALIRRYRKMTPPASLDYGDLKIDLVQRRVRLKENPIDLTPQEFSLLYVLAQAAGIALSRSELLRLAWPDAIDNPRTIDTHVLSLRKKIEIDPQHPNLIQTVRNVGYRFNQEILEVGQGQLNGRNIQQRPIHSVRA